jgi:hypothetical protein
VSFIGLPLGSSGYDGRSNGSLKNFGCEKPMAFFSRIALPVAKETYLYSIIVTGTP